MKKVLSTLLAITMILSFIAAIADETPQITSRDMTFYLSKLEDTRTLPVYFVGDFDVPYFSVEDWAELYTYMMHTYIHKDEQISFGLSYSRDGDTATLTRTDGDPYPMIVDCAADTITFWDYDAFIRPEDDRVLIDVLSADEAHADDDAKFFHRTKDSYERYGNQLVVDTGDYGIDLVADEKGCYVPLQTLSDFLLAFKYQNVFYNGEAVFITLYDKFTDEESGELTELGKQYFSVEPKERSEAMGQFSYKELCLAFDYLYGLKDAHGIESFDNLCLQTGYRDVLMGTDPNAADEALYITIYKHLDDLHSTFNLGSPLSRRGISEDLSEEFGIGLSYRALLMQLMEYEGVRAEAYPDGVPIYEEIGNTAYITFDRFKDIPDDVNYYETAPTADVDDTIGIMIYAYSQIMRENSPVENVVLDLSCNIGGSVDTAIFTVCAFLGEGYGSVRNTMSGGLATGVYNADVNLDGKFDENDRGLTGKKIYVLTSPVSFSCGNLVPNILKHSNKVTLMGRTSGGGACCVLPMSTAYGSAFNLSGPMCLSFTKNGAFYDIESGAEPEIALMHPASFYDRAGLTEYINTIR